MNKCIRIILVTWAVLVSYPAMASALQVEYEQLASAADSLHSIGRTDSAELVGKRAIELAYKTGNNTNIVSALSSQGVFLRSLGKIDEALSHYGKALEIVTSGAFRENPDEEAVQAIGTLYVNLATLNVDTQHKEDAVRNARFAGEWGRKSGDEQFRSAVFGVAGSVLTACGELEDAARYQELAYASALKCGDKVAAFRTSAYSMLVSSRLGDDAAARVWRAKCQELMEDIPAMARLVYYQAECSICLKGGDRRGALKWFDKILQIDGIDNLPFVKFDCYNNMHIAYAELGDYRNAYESLLKGNELRDSLWAQEKAESLRDLTVKYETKETELALAQSEARRSTTLMWLFAAIGLLLIGGIVFVVYAGRQRRRRMLNELEFANLRHEAGMQYIEGLETERSRMARELHDGVCNDLLAIKMNIERDMPAGAGDTLAGSIGLIETCRDSVRRISHELMPPEFQYASVDEVVRYFVVKQQKVNEGKITVTYTSQADSAWNRIPDATALEVYRICQEAVGNAVKHSAASEVAVSLTLAGDSLKLKVHDNGRFISSGRSGIGIASMSKRAAAIGGALEISHPEGKGTEVELCVKIAQSH